MSMKTVSYRFRKMMMLVALVLAATSLQAQMMTALFPFQNPALSPEVRAEDLLSRLTLEEKAQLMLDVSPAIPRLGVPAYQWWNECLHGCARSGLATVFPQSIGMAAAWDPVLLEQVFTVASNEQRIKYHQARAEGKIDRYEGLTVWTPNINIFRDPRWGRGQETYGEDPYLTAELGKAVIFGLQGEPMQGLGAASGQYYDRLHACVKHFAVHSGPEWNRHTYDAKNISKRDLAETYLYAFERCVKEADVKEVMCAYNRYEGEACCGSNRLLTQILRNEWGYKHLVVSDCSAIRDLHTPEPKGHGTHPSVLHSSSAAVLSGTDINCGGSFKNLPKAVAAGLITEADLDVSVRRLLVARFRLGDFDDESVVPWYQIPESYLANAESDALALKMAQESMTLLHNENNALPIVLGDKPMTIAVVGPNANDSLTLLGNYNGIPRRSITALQGIQSKLRAQDKLIYDKASEWVLPEKFISRYGNCRTQEGTGFEADYYNNVNMEGEPVAHQVLPSPFQRCTSGATVFAPGVNLRHFSARYRTTYHADKNETLLLDLYVNGEGRIIVNGDTINTFHQNHGSRRVKRNIKVQAGQNYDIQVDFAYRNDDAQFNLDLGVVEASTIENLLANVKDADVVIYVGGISPQLEGEEMKVPFEGFKGGDRTEIELPKIQRETLKALHEAGKKVIMVNMSGSAIALTPETETCDAILQAWYGGQQAGQAIADVLFGDYNPAGRLPVTFYRNMENLPDFEDYNMKGHTYRYFKNEVLFPFGHGLSYTTYKYGKAKLYSQGKKLKSMIINALEENPLHLQVKVKNTGKMDGDEVLQVYLRRDDDVDGPVKTLRGFARQHIKAGESIVYDIELAEPDWRTFNEVSGQLETLPGKYTLYYGGSSADEALQTLRFELK